MWFCSISCQSTMPRSHLSLPLRNGFCEMVFSGGRSGGLRNSRRGRTVNSHGVRTQDSTSGEVSEGREALRTAGLETGATITDDLREIRAELPDLRRLRAVRICGQPRGWAGSTI